MKRKTKSSWKMNCLLVIFGILLLGFGFFKQVNAEINREVKLTSKEFIEIQQAKIWKDGLVVKTSKEQQNQLQVTLTHEQETKDYLSVFIYDASNRDLSGKDGLAFYLSNPNSEALLVNLSINSSTDGDWVLMDKSFIWLQDDAGAFESIAFSEGVFAIPAGFSGEVYLPLEMFERPSSKASSIDTLGVTLVVPPDTKELSATIGNLYLLTDDSSHVASYLQAIQVNGTDELTIPDLGAKVALFTAKETTETSQLVFYLNDTVSGIELSPDGRLEIQATADYPEELTIFVKDKTTETLARKVIKLTQMSQSLAEINIPKPADVESYETSESLLLETLLGPLRIGLALFVVSFGLLVAYWVGLAKRNHQVSNHLLQQVSNQERNKD